MSDLGQRCHERALSLRQRQGGNDGQRGAAATGVKECYFYLDATPAASYLKMLYKYPQAEFPHTDLIAVNAARGKSDPEYELLDTGVFDENRYFDIVIEYAKATLEDLLEGAEPGRTGTAAGDQQTGAAR